MAKENDVQMQARTLPKEQRQSILQSFRETELHQHLKELFKAMQPNYTVEVTHGTGELGKDLVIVKRDNLTTNVIGVVVKCGNISGKTLGDVDEIKNKVSGLLPKSAERKIEEITSQVEQAKVHPAELATVFQKLKIDSVFVVLAGKFSGNARERLSAEMKGQGEIFDIEWLISKFTEFYPQVFFDGQAIDFLQAKLQELETKNWLIQNDSNHLKNLSEYFVEPMVASVEAPLLLSSESLKLIWKKQRLPFSKLQTVLDDGKRLILAGDPGTGKSAALAKLAINLLKDAHSQVSKGGPDQRQIEVPIFVVAKDLLVIESSEELIALYCEHKELRSRFKIKVMFVDGLDEVASAERQEIIDKARKFSDELQCSAIITSRKIDIVDKPPEGFEKFELLPFEIGQAIKLFEKLQGNKKLLSALKDGLDKIQHQIPIIPLSLVLLMEIVEEHQEVPSSVTELYDRFTDSVLGRYDKKKGIEVLFDYLVKKRFLSTLAHDEFLKKNKLEITSQDFKIFCSDYNKQYGWDSDHMGSFLKEIERAGIIKIGSTIEFTHRSFLDYFTALYLHDKRGDIDGLNDFIVKNHFDDIWSEVSFFFIGLKREISKDMLKDIFDFPGDSAGANFNKILAGRLLQAGWHSTSEAKYYGVSRAFAFAPIIRKELVESQEFQDSKVPTIVADFIVSTISREALRSTFLQQELKAYYASLVDGDTTVDIHALLPVLWTVKSFMSKEELTKAVSACMKGLSIGTRLSAQEKASALVLLMTLQRNDKETTIAIDRKLKRLQKTNPGVLKAILPPQKKGFRTPKQK